MLWFSFVYSACQPKVSDTAVQADQLPDPCTDCIFQNRNNYTYSSVLDIATVPLKPESNLQIDWSALSIDVQGQDFDPTTVEQATLVVFLNQTPEEIQVQLANDTLQQADISLYVLCEPDGNTSCQLGDFGILGADLYVPDYFLANQGVWMLALRSSQIKGAHSFAFLIPDPSAENTSVALDNNSAILTVDVDFRSLLPVVLPSEESNISIDWREIDRDGLGNDIEPTKIDSVFVARYDRSITELEDSIFDLMTDADALWTMPLDTSGEANLQNLEGDVPFNGIDDDHSWLLALECSSCTSPAPRFVTRLQVP